MCGKFQSDKSVIRQEMTGYAVECAFNEKVARKKISWKVIKKSKFRVSRLHVAVLCNSYIVLPAPSYHLIVVHDTFNLN